MPKSLKNVAGPRGIPGLGVLPRIKKDPLGLVMSAATDFGDIVKLRLGPKELFLLNHPSLVEQVLRTNADKYQKSRFYDRLKPIFGEGLIVAEGMEWRNQRTAAAPAFATTGLKEIAVRCVELTHTMLERWEKFAAQERPIDVAAEMMRLTLGVVLAGLFSKTVSETESEELYDAISVVLRGAERRIWALAPIPDFMPTTNERRFRGALATLDRFIYRIIDERHRQQPGNDFLGFMMQARHSETQATYTDKQLRDQMMFMILAGHETTASALAWTWYLLSTHPGVAERLHLENTQVLRGDPRYEDLADLGYTQMVFEEAMRLYPPAWTISRTAVEADELDGHLVPAGTSVMLCPYVLHRDGRFWENPEAFDPERFRPEKADTRPRFAYFPFSGGPRACIGSRFALIEAKIVIAMVAQRFDLRLVPGQTVEIEPMISLRPRHGLYMTLSRSTAPRIAA